MKVGKKNLPDLLEMGTERKERLQQVFCYRSKGLQLAYLFLWPVRPVGPRKCLQEMQTGTGHKLGEGGCRTRSM